MSEPIEIFGKQFIPTEFDRSGEHTFPQDAQVTVWTPFRGKETVRAITAKIQALEGINWDRPPKERCPDCPDSPVLGCAIGRFDFAYNWRPYDVVGCGKTRGETPKRRLLAVPDVPAVPMRPLVVLEF